MLQEVVSTKHTLREYEFDYIRNYQDPVNTNGELINQNYFHYFEGFMNEESPRERQEYAS